MKAAAQELDREELVSWSLTSLFSTNMAISETKSRRVICGLYFTGRDKA